MEKVEVGARDGACVALRTHGAHVTSWKPASGEERLFLSSRSAFTPNAAIRGGVPIIFPQFATMGPLPKHGFARVREWELLRAGRTRKGQGEAQLRLTANGGTRARWNHAFQATFVVTVGGMSLSLALSVLNEDAAPFEFTAALHTYLLIDDVREASVRGLQGVCYRDAAAGNAQGRQEEEELEAGPGGGELDRIYFDVRAPLEVRDALRRTRVAMTGFTDVVVWNPGEERAAALTDLEPGGWLRMLCVEAAAIGTPVRLEPGERWTGQQTLTAL
jgi:glucose-6-phosphate 1-epimerase